MNTPEVYGEVVWKFDDPLEDNYLMIFWKDRDAYVRRSLFRMIDMRDWKHLSYPLNPTMGEYMFYGEWYRINWIAPIEYAWKRGDEIKLTPWDLRNYKYTTKNTNLGSREARGKTVCASSGIVTAYGCEGTLLHVEYTTHHWSEWDYAHKPRQNRCLIDYRDAVRP